MVSELSDPRAGLSADRCLTVAESAERLAAVGAHLSAEELARARTCAVEARGIGLRMRLARDYLRLVEPLEGPHEAARLLTEVADPEIRDQAFHVMVEQGERALPVLEDLTRHHDVNIRWHAYEAIRRIGGPAAIPDLVRGIQDSDFSVRWAAAHGLIEAGEAALAPILGALVRSVPSIGFHRAALHALRRLRDSGAGEGMEALLASLARETTVYESGALAFDLLVALRRPAAAGQDG